MQVLRPAQLMLLPPLAKPPAQMQVLRPAQLMVLHQLEITAKELVDPTLLLIATGRDGTCAVQQRSGHAHGEAPCWDNTMEADDVNRKPITVNFTCKHGNPSRLMRVLLHV